MRDRAELELGEAQAAIKLGESLMADQMSPSEVQTLFLQGIAHALCAIAIAVTAAEDTG